jgi:filamentous hemagglutinin family protein
VELRSNRNPRAYARGLILGASLAALLAASPALAGGVLPTGGHVTAGQASIGANSNGLVIDQASGHAIINWQNFSIGAGNAVKFNNGSGATLNRVTGGNLSQIDGVLKATGSIYLINPQGVVVGPGGKVITGGSFVASTRDVDDDAFMKGGPLHASGTSNGAVVNQGKIVSRYGDTILIGKSVSNSGIIKATRGTAGLAAGDDVTLRPMDGDARISISAGKGDVTNTGTIAAAQAELNAAGGNVYAVAGNQGGIVVTGTKEVGGRVWLTGGDTAQISGTVSAFNKDGSGGTIIATAPIVTVSADARISASGTTGGTVLLGGDEAGGNDPARKHVTASVATAKTTTVAQGAQISADGATGAGGAVVVWSDDDTSYNGLISARGATAGGFAEVSSHGMLDYTGIADLSSASGFAGMLLLDPRNLTIQASGTNSVTTASSGGTTTYTASAASSIITVSTITAQLANSNVTLTTTNASGTGTGLITVSTDVSWSSTKTLTVNAYGSISLNGAITAANGGLVLTTGNGASSIAITNPISVANLTINSGVQITDTAAVSVGGTFNLASGQWSQNPLGGALPAFFAGNFVLGSGAGFFRVANGDGSSGNPYLIADVYGLQGMSTVYGNAFALSGDIDASATSGWNGGAGFTPLGSFGQYLTQTLDGQNHSINGLVINDTSGFSTGLIRDNYGSIKNIGLSGGSVQTSVGTSTNGQIGAVGALAGYNFGTITNAHSSANVSGVSSVGGLIGSNGGFDYYSGQQASQTGSIDNSYYELGTVTGQGDTGGLVGSNGIYQSNVASTITNSHVAATAIVNGTRATGGLVGQNYGTASISGSFSGATVNGVVSLTDQIYGVGGFVGQNDGTVDSSFATGTVSADNSSNYVGGFAGTAYGVTTNSHATGAVSGGTSVGGFAGDIAGSTTNSYATGTVTVLSGGGGGFAGVAEGTLSNDYATGTVRAGDASQTWFGYAAGGIGGFAGSVSAGTVSNSYATGDVLGFDGSDGVNYSSTVGGFAANNWGTILQSHATGNVTGYSSVGGLVGSTSSNSLISGSYATGQVTAGLAGYSTVSAGGLVGENDGTITLSYATGNVSSVPDNTNFIYDFGVGGLVGYNNGGTISQSYATGTATGSMAVGGLVGYMSGGSISDAYATGDITGWSMVGGLVGDNEFGAITNTYAAGTPHALYDTAAGLVGANGEYGSNVYPNYGPGTITNSYWNKDVAAVGVASDTGSGTQATGLTAAQMHVSSNFANFDFVNTWAPADATYRPELYGVSYVVKVSAAGGTAQYGDAISSALTYHSLQNGDLVSSITGLTITGAAQGSGVGSYAISAGGAALTSSSGNAYRFIYEAGTISITPRQLTLSLVGNTTKTYDTTTDAILTAANYGSLGNIYNGEDVSLASMILGGSYADKNAGGGKTVSVSGLHLTGAAAANYTLGTVSGNIGTINQATLSVGLTGTVEKTYNQTADATLAAGNYGSLVGVLGHDDVSLDTGTAIASYDTANAGQNKTVTVNGLQLSGADALNYSFGVVSANIGLIDKATLTTSLKSTTITKTYDTTNIATVAASNFNTLSGLYSGDNVSLSLVTAAATYADANAGTTKLVTVTGLQLSGAAAANYTIADSVSRAVGTISKKALTEILIGGISKTYDKTTTATLTSANYGALTGVLGNDDVSLASMPTSGTYNSATGGSGKTVTVTGLTLTGAAAGNYSISSGSGVIGTINAIILSYTANAASRLYGAGNPALSGSVAGTFASGDTLATITTGTAAFTSAANSATNVGGYAITGAGVTVRAASTSNYVFVQAAGNANALTINPVTLTYTANAASRTYGATDPAFSGTVSGFVLSQTQAIATTGTLGFTTTATANSGVGSYAINGGGLTANNGNYVFTQAAANATRLTIGAATLTYVANTASRLYGAANPAFSGLVSGLKNSDTLSGVTTGTAAFTTLANGAANVGSYAITGSGLSLSTGNYVFAQATGNATALTINPATLTITAGNATKVYGDTLNFAGTEFSISGLLNSDNVSNVALTSAGAAATATVNGGSPYAITASNAAGVGLSNYTIGYVDGGLIINPANLTITANSNQSKVYGDTDPTFGYIISTGSLVNGDTLTGALSRDAGEDVGNYAITQGSLAASSNYTLNYAIGTNFNITSMALTVAANSGLTKIYGDADPVFGYQLTAGHLVGGDTLTGALSRDTGEDAGNYAINQGSLAASANYTLSYTTGTNFNITPMALTVAANSGQAKTYGDTDPVFGYSFTTGHLVGTDALTGVLSRDAGEDVGSYAINQGSLAASANYTLSYVGSTTFNVTPMNLTIAANSGQTRVYGDADPVFGYQLTAGHLVGGDALTGALSRDAGSNVGNYAINQGSLAASTNYTLSYAGANFNITPMALAVSADSKSKIYGASDPVGFYAVSSGHLVGSDTLTGTLSRDAGETVGAYAITRGTLDGGNNYTLAFIPGTLSITPAALTITAGSGNKVYGETASLTGFTASGLVRGDQVNTVILASDGAAATTNTGSYAIVASSAVGPGLGNYVISYNPGVLTVTPRALTVTIANASAVYGAAAPGFTASASGLVNGDTLSGAPVAIGTHVGTYAITPGTLAVSANYAVSFQGGTFTITPAGLTVTANNIAAEDVSLAQPTASYAGLVNGDSSAVVSGLQFGLFPVTGTSYDVVPFGASAADYTIVYVAGVLTVSATQPSQPTLPSQIALAIPPQSGSASGSLTIGGQTFVFANAATSAIPGSSDGGAPGITLFQVGLPGHLSGFTNLVVSDYSNATGDSDRLATE